LATTILAHQKSYYEALEKANRQTDVTEWLTWFADIALEAQRRTIMQVEFLIAKTKLLDRLRGHINERQQKALLRMFREGPKGSRAGLVRQTTARSPEPHPPQQPAIWQISRKRARLSARVSASTHATQ